MHLMMMADRVLWARRLLVNLQNHVVSLSYVRALWYCLLHKPVRLTGMIDLVWSDPPHAVGSISYVERDALLQYQARSNASDAFFEEGLRAFGWTHSDLQAGNAGSLLPPDRMVMKGELYIQRKYFDAKSDHTEQCLSGINQLRTY